MSAVSGSAINGMRFRRCASTGTWNASIRIGNWLPVRYTSPTPPSGRAVTPVDFLLRRITPWTEAVLRLTLSIDIRLGIFVLPVLLVLYLLIGLLKVIVALFHQWHRLIGLSDLSL